MRRPIPILLLCIVLAGCSASAQGRAADDPPASTTSARPTVASTPPVRTASPTPTPTKTPSHKQIRPTPSRTPTARPTTPSPTQRVPAGRVVVLDPGHNGGNASHPEIINQLVPAGNGLTKPCNTTGTATNAGYPEHAFTWAVALRVRQLLEQQHITVIMTRPNDAGVGPCVNKRAAIGNAADAAAVVSIHGDGAAAGHGF